MSKVWVYCFSSPLNLPSELELLKSRGYRVIDVSSTSERNRNGEIRWEIVCEKD